VEHLGGGLIKFDPPKKRRILLFLFALLACLRSSFMANFVIVQCIVLKIIEFLSILIPKVPKPVAS